MSFADTARRLCGQAGLLLGWRPAEFWQVTPDELGDALGAMQGLRDAAGATGAAPIGRATLDLLMEMHPDG